MTGPTRPGLDHTHDPALQSWVSSANGHSDFPIQNLPFGMFSVGEEEPKRRGVAIGNCILDIDACSGLGLLPEWKGRPHRTLRHAISAMLAQGHETEKLASDILHKAADCTLHLPTPQIGDYTDFYAGIHHARAVGALFRPSEPLLPNYKYLPIGYHGRASSVRPSGEPIRRPSGQRKPAADPEPTFGPCRNLDFELELGIWICAENTLGEPLPIAQAPDHIAGYCLLNDWSARDIQAWEYQPLGPFLAKSFATSVSPWVVTPEALAPFRCAQPTRPAGDPHSVPLSLGRGRPGHRRPRHQTGSLHPHRRDARGRRRPPPPCHQQHQPSLLDPSPAPRPSRQQRLQPPTRRPAGQRHHLRPDPPPSQAACWS